MQAKKNRVAVFAETPFQLIAGLNVACNYLHANGADLFLTRDMYETENKFAVAPGHPYITGVHYVRRNGVSPSFAQKVRYRLKYGMVPSFFNVLEEGELARGPRVDAVIGMKYNVWIPNYLTFMREKVPVYLVEEGCGDYNDGEISGRPVVPEWCGRTDVIASVERVYMMPAYFMQRNPGQPAAETPRVHSPGFGRLLASLFSSAAPEEEPLFSAKRIFYFDWPFDKDVFSSETLVHEINALESQLLHTLFDDAEISKAAAVKKHPRSMVDYSQYNGASQMCGAWEYILSQLAPGEIDEKILIGPPTTAMITGKGMFDREPYIISLQNYYRPVFSQIVGNCDEQEDYVRQVRQMYRSPEKVMFPETADEVRDILRRLLKEGNG